MKESSYHDPKMEAYCKMVRRLEDKFDGLELNHGSPDVFASDLYKASVDYGKPEQEGDQLPELTLRLNPPKGSYPP
jgi:hypothetical protein